MSVLSLISNSRGRFNRKHRPGRPKASTSPGKARPPKRAIPTAASRSDPRAQRKGQAMGDGEKLVRMRRLREEKESASGQDEENMDMIRRMGGEPIAALPGDAGQNATGKTERPTGRSVGGKGGAAQSAGTEEPFVAQDAPCATSVEEAARSGHDNGFFGDLFTAVVEEEIAPIKLLAAALPDVSVDELLAEAARIKSMVRRTSGAGT